MSRREINNLWELVLRYQEMAALSKDHSLNMALLDLADEAAAGARYLAALWEAEQTGEAAPGDGDALCRI